MQAGQADDWKQRLRDNCDGDNEKNLSKKKRIFHLYMYFS